MRKSLKEKSGSSVAVVPPNPVQDMATRSLDKLTVNIKCLRLMDNQLENYAMKVMYCDQKIINQVVMPIGRRDVENDKTILSGYMSYDPSDYEKISYMADQPLCVRIQPTKNTKPVTTGIKPIIARSSRTTIDQTFEEISCCNVDILSLIIGEEKLIVKKRLEPHRKPPILLCKSWDNLPFITMELVVTRNPMNQVHHSVMKNANIMKITVVAAYNMPVDFDNEYNYVAASRMPNMSVAKFNQGYKPLQRFEGLNFCPKWECLRVRDSHFPTGDEKFDCAMEDLQNDDKIALERYMKSTKNTTVWGSFHRTLMLETSDQSLWTRIHRYHWPLEVHIYGEKCGFSFMAFMNLFKLLYPGEDTVRLAVPLQWIRAEAMMEACNCELLLTPNEKAPSTSVQTAKNFNSKSVSESAATYVSADVGSMLRSTGSDENCSFVVVEIKLARSLKKAVIPAHISTEVISDMLKEMEEAEPHKRHCYGRGQLNQDWETTVKSAASALRKVPFYSMSEYCAINRQLSETRTRVEISTSCWQEAAVYVNNNFVIQDFLVSEDSFEEMLMMTHACLTLTTCKTLMGMDNYKNRNILLKAARHARQLQDMPHAMELYLQRAVENPHNEDCWRELSTCLKDIDRDWANVCLNKAVVMNPRHPLTLISKGCTALEEDPTKAEVFFVALLALYPFWSIAWVITSVYYMDRELFHMADQIIMYKNQLHKDGMSEELNFPRAWEHELGDWWDSTPLLPGMSPYLDAADLLLRLRALNLADVCVSRALCETGESAAYYHLLALCCRLRGNPEDALCHIRVALEKYGEINYLRSLEGECLHQLNEVGGAATAFDKAGSCVGAYSLLLSTPSRPEDRARTILVDLTRRQPNAYAWMALADDWMARAKKEEAEASVNVSSLEICASACAIQALKWDRRAGRAWALLAKLVNPSARRLFCLKMARSCGYETSDTALLGESRAPSKQSLCHYITTTLRECRCKLCENIQF